ncbi:MAG: NUDIX domain-containing protein [Christensenellales bacterium]
MAIRSTAKALVIDGDRVLLVRCVSGAGKVTYVLPGGGQNLYEPLRDAVAREVMEETGYAVRTERLLGVCETISMDEKARCDYPDYTHRMFHIFLCRRADEIRHEPLEKDLNQDECLWMTLREADALDNLLPTQLRGQISRLANAEMCDYLGCEYVS